MALIQLYSWINNEEDILNLDFTTTHFTSDLDAVDYFQKRDNLNIPIGSAYAFTLDFNINPLIFSSDLFDWSAKNIINKILNSYGINLNNDEFQNANCDILNAPQLQNVQIEQLIDMYKLIDAFDVNDSKRNKAWFEYLSIYLNKLGINAIQYSVGTSDFYILLTKNLEIIECKKIEIHKEGERDLFKQFFTEDTRMQLVSTSRNAGPYKNQKYGKNRFERKKLSKIARTVKQYNKIDMNQLFKNDVLEVEIPVIGESDEYLVTVRMDGVIAELAKILKNNKFKLEYKIVVQALTKIFNSADLQINCTCPDHKYHFSHWNIIRGVSTLDSAHDPGQGKGIANPNDDQGRGCKHSLLVLNNGDWILKVASVINNYIHYMSEKSQKLFLKLIFPKLYGITSDEMVDQDLLDKETLQDCLDSNESFIDAINEYGKNRGKFQKGSNINPVYADKLEAEQKEENTKQQVDPNKKNLQKAVKETERANKLAQKESEKADKEASKPIEPPKEDEEQPV